MSTEPEYTSIQDWREAFFPEASRREREQHCFENPEVFAEKLVTKLALSLSQANQNQAKTSASNISR
jgi:hypothetical protein